MSQLSRKSLEFVVAFDEADGEGIVFFGNYFRLAHRAFEYFLPQLGFTWEEWFKNSYFGVPLRHVSADYRHPLRPGDHYKVNIHVVKLGESSVTFSYEFLNVENQITALVETSHVFVARPNFKKIEIPENVRHRLATALKA